MNKEIKVVIYWTILSPKHSLDPHIGAMNLESWILFGNDSRDYHYIDTVEIPDIDQELYESVKKEISSSEVAALELKLAELKGDNNE